jgi:hypothetical protein
MSEGAGRRVVLSFGYVRSSLEGYRLNMLMQDASAKPAYRLQCIRDATKRFFCGAAKLGLWTPASTCTLRLTGPTDGSAGSVVIKKSLNLRNN